MSQSYDIGPGTANGFFYDTGASFTATNGLKCTVKASYDYYKLSTATEGITYKFMPQLCLSTSGAPSDSLPIHIKYVIAGRSETYTLTCTAGKAPGFNNKVIATSGSYEALQPSTATSRTWSTAISYNWGSSSYYNASSTSITLNFSGLSRSYTFNHNNGTSKTTVVGGYYGASKNAPSATSKSSDVSEKTVTITFDPKGGTVSGSLSESIKIIETTDYAFKEWNRYTSGTGSSLKAGASFTLDSNSTYYAIYESRDGGTTGNTVRLPIMNDRTGYIFKGWYSDNGREGDSGGTSKTIFKSDAKIWAEWSTGAYRFTIKHEDMNGKTIADSDEGREDFGSKVDARAYAKTINGYVVNSIQPSDIITIKTDEAANVATIIYGFTANYIKCDPGSHGTIPSEWTYYSYTINSGTPEEAPDRSFALPIPEVEKDSLYSFVGWTGGSVKTPTTEIRIYPAKVTFDGSTISYEAHYERVSKKWRVDDIWKPIMNTYVKDRGTWKLVKKGNSWTKVNGVWKRETQT